MSHETYVRTLPMGLLGCRFIFISSEPSTDVEVEIYVNILNELKERRRRGMIHILRLSPDALRVEMVRDDNVDEDRDGNKLVNSFNRLAEHYNAFARPRTSAAAHGVPHALFYEFMNAHRNGVIVWWKPTIVDTLEYNTELLNIKYEHERMSVFKANMPPHQDPDSLEPIKVMMGPRFESEVLNIPVPSNTRPAFPTHVVEWAFLPRNAVHKIKTPFGFKPRIYISYDPAKGAAAASNRSDAILMACIVQHLPPPYAAEATATPASGVVDVHYNTVLPTHMSLPGSVLSATRVAINTGVIPGRAAVDESLLGGRTGRSQVEVFPAIVVRRSLALNCL